MFSMATPDSRKVDGDEKDMTEWHTVVFFGKQAEIAGEHLVKGSEAYIKGRLKTIVPKKGDAPFRELHLPNVALE